MLLIDGRQRTSSEPGLVQHHGLRNNKNPAMERWFIKEETPEAKEHEKKEKVKKTYEKALLPITHPDALSTRRMRRPG